MEAGAEDDPPVDRMAHSAAVGEAFDCRPRPGAVGGERHERAEVSRGVVPPPNAVEDAGDMPVGVGVVGLLPQNSVEGRFGEPVVAQFGQNTSQPRAGLEVVGVEFDGGVVPFP